MYHSGHTSAIASVGLLLVSTAFLIWVEGKAGNTYQKLGKIVGAVALALSVLLVIGSIVLCVQRAVGCDDEKKGCPMMQMMEQEKGMPGMGMMPGMGKGPGMHRRGMMGEGMGRGMGPVGMPSQPPAVPETPEKAKGE